MVEKSVVGKNRGWRHFGGMKVEADFPDITEEAAQEPEQGRKILTELACILYQRKIISAGQGRRMSGLDVIEFQGALKERGIPIHYTAEMLAEDFAYAQSYAGR
jgi:predicted HTH domain antitoxin